MDQIKRALWYIESHLFEDIGLADIASVSLLSRFQLSRTFAAVTGMTVTGYIRQRRLSEAARALATQEASVLQVALDVGYGSHEGFTRAFKAHFGVAPETIRQRAATDHLDLSEPIDMTDHPAIDLPQPTFETHGPFLMCGLREYRTFDKLSQIPNQWQRFAPHIGHLGPPAGPDSYGLCFDVDRPEEGFDYMCAVAVRSLDDLPAGLTGVRLERRSYAVFPHTGHISTIGATCAAIFGQWKPTADVAVSDGPLTMIERYTPRFNPMTGEGGLDIWVPLDDA